MACPLYKKMKSRGTSFYAFPSASQDLNLAFNNDNYKLKFSKFALLNIPEQKIVIDSGLDRDQTKGKLNFDKDDQGPKFFNFQPDGNADLPTNLSEQLIESLRNYVANYDSTLRESRINSNTDFYNINEKVTPTEMIFWKWCKKLNLIDFEPAIHNIDWDKNLPDFDNENGNDFDYFRKYLWKERDVNYYSCEITVGPNISSNPDDKPIVIIPQDAKFKVGDYVYLSGVTSSVLSANTEYKINYIEHNTNETIIELDFNGTYIENESSVECIVYLSYNKLIEYIGDIQINSKVQTSKESKTEITANIPNHCGKTPTILFDIYDNINYKPGLEMPILPEQQQEEIVGSENTNSPIRLNPENYPGTYFGYFDTVDKTYKCESGDKLRKSGNYYGVNLTNNIGLDFDNYFEKLTDFNSDNIDGLKLDINTNHYLKMNLPGNQISNFDEFNSTYFDSAPEDFEFNAILWYYELDDGSGEIVNNLYGIEFLNNPNDDDDDCDVNNTKITPYKKYVSNGNQDGVSFTFNLNINFNIDNDVLPLSYDPTTTYNQFGFDLYQNILQTNAQLQENFLSIISGFTTLYQDVNDIKSLIYSQTQLDQINNRINNLNDLLELYSTFQFVDSDTTQIETNYDGPYPTLKVNTLNTQYSDIQNVNISDVMYYNNTTSGNSYSIQVPVQNQQMINIYNDNNDFSTTANIVLSKDLAYKQSMDIYIIPSLSESTELLNINLNYNNGNGNVTENTLLSEIILPVDLSSYDSLNPTGSTYNNAYYTNNNVNTYGQSIVTGITETRINLMEDLFVSDDYVYIDNFYLQSGTTIIDKSGVYQVTSHNSGDTYGYGAYININLSTTLYTLKTKPKISYYKGWKINILRTNESTTSSITDRYKITKELI